MLTSYWSEASISSQASGVISREQLNEALAQIAQVEECTTQTEEHADQLQSIMSAMETQLFATLEGDFSKFQDMLASFSTPVPPAPATVPFDSASVHSYDDEMLEEEDDDLADF